MAAVAAAENLRGRNLALAFHETDGCPCYVPSDLSLQIPGDECVYTEIYRSSTKRTTYMLSVRQFHSETGGATQEVFSWETGVENLAPRCKAEFTLLTVNSSGNKRSSIQARQADDPAGKCVPHMKTFASAAQRAGCKIYA